ncbi:MAG: DUF5659 domain-containing protein [Candidatus Auribacterota bacterium]
MQNEYETSDLYLSAFLKCKGMRLKGKRQTIKRCIFVFQDRSDRQNLISEFFNNGVINVTDYKNALQDLKIMVFNV